jgi:DNA-binding response OmpR family regulator
VNGRDAELTQKEFAVFLLLVANEDKELSYDAIFEHVWRSPIYNDSSALRQQVSRLKKKLGEEDTDEFSILNKSGKGYTFTMK